jgi:hypothetical protein
VLVLLMLLLLLLGFQKVQNRVLKLPQHLHIMLGPAAAQPHPKPKMQRLYGRIYVYTSNYMSQTMQLHAIATAWPILTMRCNLSD